MRSSLTRSAYCLVVLLGFTVTAWVTPFAAEPASPPAYNIRMENTWIPMKDGVRLAVTLYMPDGGKADERFPAVSNTIPIVRTMAPRNATTLFTPTLCAVATFAPALTSAASAPARALLLNREYSEQEQLDGLQIIDWLAHQPWSNGNVGMMGISWSGFNSLQMAMRHAPELKAIIAVDATAELFHDDVHYIDGMAHVDEFELNMDMAPGHDRRARLHARRKSSRPALRRSALVPALFQASA